MVKLPPLPPNTTSANVAWFRDREHYDQCKAAFSDGPSMRTYEQWLQLTEEAIQQFQDRSVVVHRIEFDLEAFLVWCCATKVKPNTQARTTFAAMVGAQIDQGGKPDPVH